MLWLDNRRRSGAIAIELMCKIGKHFVNATEPRVLRGTNYDLVEMIFITLTATICGGYCSAQT